MSILERFKKINHLNFKEIFIIAVIVLVGLLGFGLGRLSVVEEKPEPVTIEYSDHPTVVANVSKISPQEGSSTPSSTASFVASRNGTRYYLSTCSAAMRIKANNRISFATAAEAERAGYKPAANCPGL